MELAVSVRENADGTLTCRCGRERYTLTPQPWWDETKTLEEVKWGLVLCGISLQGKTVTVLRD